MVDSVAPPLSAADVARLRTNEAELVAAQSVLDNAIAELEAIVDANRRRRAQQSGELLKEYFEEKDRKIEDALVRAKEEQKRLREAVNEVRDSYDAEIRR